MRLWAKVRHCPFFKDLFLFIDFGGRGWGREREREEETSICGSTYLWIHWLILFFFHWLILVCALTRDRACNLGESRRCSNQPRYLARDRYYPFYFWEMDGGREGFSSLLWDLHYDDRQKQQIIIAKIYWVFTIYQAIYMHFHLIFIKSYYYWLYFIVEETGTASDGGA